MLRLRVAEYFDSVVNEIDLYTETKIQSIKTQTEEDWWNKRRREQIDAVRRIERACLDHVNTLKVQEKESGEWMKRVFVEYCFTVNYADLLYLAKANRYVEPKEKRFLDVHLIQGEKTVNVAIDSHQSLRVTIEEFEASLHYYFLTDAPVIDISSGLDKCCRIKRARISAAYDTDQSPFCLDFEDLSIQECELYFCIENTDKEKEAVDVIKSLMTCRDRVSTKIKIDLEYYDHLDPSQDMKALAQSVELNDPVKFYFSKSRSNFQEFYPSSLLEKYKNPSNIFVKVVNWQFISYISFSDVLLEDLEKADLSSLYSLTILDLKISPTGKNSSDWMFLDACRSSLEHVFIKYPDFDIPLSLSSRTFSGMTKLKSLELFGSFSIEFDNQATLFGDLNQLDRLFIFSFAMPFAISRKSLSGMTNLKSLDLIGSFSVDTDSQEELFADLTQLERLIIDRSNSTKPFPLSRKTFCSMTNLQRLILKGAISIEPNNQEELFADLINLKKLNISLDEQALATKWFIHSPTVEDLSLTFVESLNVASSQIRFKLPQLASLELSFDSDRTDIDLTDMMSCFSHVKKLTIMNSSLDIMTKGWFNRLTCVEELVLSLRCQGLINSQLFEGLDQLAKLKLFIWSGNTLDRCLLHKLVHLETVTFVNITDKTDLLDTEDKSMFDGLNSLRTIEFGCNYRSYVYFENLGRFLLVVK